MAQARKRAAGGGTRRKGNRNWLLLLLGLGIGVAAVFLGQLLTERNLHRTVTGWFESKPAPTKDAQRGADKPKAKFDFYTILPETETVLPERGKKEPKPAKPEKPEEDVSYVLQAGSFNNFDDADQLKARLALQGLTASIKKVTIEGKGDYHRVRLGPYDKLETLDAATQQLNKMGIKAMRLKVVKKAGG
jgi:cell division protein FtsN